MGPAKGGRGGSSMEDPRPRSGPRKGTQRRVCGTFFFDAGTRRGRKFRYASPTGYSFRSYQLSPKISRGFVPKVTLFLALSRPARPSVFVPFRSHREEREHHAETSDGLHRDLRNDDPDLLNQISDLWSRRGTSDWWSKRLVHAERSRGNVPSFGGDPAAFSLGRKHKSAFGSRFTWKLGFRGKFCLVEIRRKEKHQETVRSQLRNWNIDSSRSMKKMYPSEITHRIKNWDLR